MQFPSDSDIIAEVTNDLPVGVWVARAPGGEFVHANAAFAEIMGMGARDDVAVGEYAAPYGIFARGGEPYPEARMPFVRALDEGATVTVDDIVIHRPDGRRVYIRAQAKPVRDAHGVVTHVVIAFIDISREVESELARAASEAALRRRERLESVGKLAGGIAHDFNNLLTVIRGVIGSLASEARDQEHPDAPGSPPFGPWATDLALVEEAVQSAAELTRSLLDFSRHRPSQRQPVSLDVAVRMVVGMVERSKRRVAFSLDLRATRDISADPVMLEQVVMNMVVNACEAMRDSGRIAVSTRDDGGPDGPVVVLEVTDSGPGIPRELIDRVFEPYVTTKGATSRRGAGLGLATVFGIVESHGGSIGVATTGPAGTTFRVTFPALPATQASAPAPRRAPPPSGGVVRGEGVVLVIDDEPGVLAVTRQVVSSAGYSVVTAADGADGIEQFRLLRDELSAVVLDMNMPGLSGLEVLRAMRAIDPTVRVVVVSGYPVVGADLAYIESGNGCFVDKPWTLHILSRAIAGTEQRPR